LTDTMIASLRPIRLNGYFANLQPKRQEALIKYLRT
jgi:hypothetical protein